MGLCVYIQNAWSLVKSACSSLCSYLLNAAQNRDSFVRERDHLTVTYPDGTTYTAYKTEIIESGQVKNLEKGIEVWSSSSHPQGRQLLESIHHQYNSTSGKHPTNNSKDITKDKFSLIKVEN